LIRSIPVWLLGSIVLIACRGGASTGHNNGGATIAEPTEDACPIGQTDEARGRFSDDCIKRLVPWHFKSLDMSKDYVLLTREIITPAHPRQLNNIYVPRHAGSTLPSLTVIVSLDPPGVPLPDFEGEESVRGIPVEMRSDRSDRKGLRGAMWIDNGVWYALVAMRVRQAATVDAMLISWATELLTAD